MQEELSVIYTDENIKNKFDVSIASLGDIYRSSMNHSKDSIMKIRSKSPSLEKPEIIKERKLEFKSICGVFSGLNQHFHKNINWEPEHKKNHCWSD